MEEIISDIQIIKAVKKITYSGVINTAHLNLNPENAPIRNYIRSHSSEKLTKFVPKLQPKKSTIIPTPLKLNIQNKKDDNDDEKQLSEDEIKNNGNDSLSSITSSDINNSSAEEIENEKNKNKNKDKNALYNIIEKKESDISEDDIDSFNLNNIKENKNMKSDRRKMLQIKEKACKNISKETKDIINDNFKNIFDIGLKKNDEEKVNLTPKLQGSISFRNRNKNTNTKPITKSIFDVLSNSSKKNIKKIKDN